MEYLVGLDRSLFIWMNSSIANGAFDWFFPFITDLHKTKVFLIFALFAVGYWIARKRRQAAIDILALTLALGLTDAVSYRILKPMADRQRPPEAGIQVTLRTDHHSGASFPSNHAANMFAAATVLSGAFPAATIGWYSFATLVALSRVYVGVHFPADILGGALLGFLIGFGVWKLRNRFFLRGSLRK